MLGINELKERIANDEGFAKMLSDAADGAYEKVKGEGFDISAEEWNKLCDLLSGEPDGEELSLDDLDNVAGGFGAFAKIPRVPLAKIDDKLRKKI